MDMQLRITLPGTDGANAIQKAFIRRVEKLMDLVWSLGMTVNDITNDHVEEMFKDLEDAIVEPGKRPSSHDDVKSAYIFADIGLVPLFEISGSGKSYHIWMDETYGEREETEHGMSPEQVYWKDMDLIASRFPHDYYLHFGADFMKDMTTYGTASCPAKKKK